jgi:hypothetical protein
VTGAGVPAVDAFVDVRGGDGGDATARACARVAPFFSQTLPRLPRGP